MNNLTRLQWDPLLLKRYDTQGPRYTSYPTALEFSPNYQQQDFVKAIAQLDSEQSLSLYIHIPFCQNICYYCACNKVITKDKSRAIEYVDYLNKEIQLLAKESGAKNIRQIHWGGGTPTYLSMLQIESIMETIKQAFAVKTNDINEVAIEVDPRTLAVEDIAPLAAMGFNRMSLGVQDFNPKVQKAVNRIQSFEMTDGLIQEARRQGFQSINIDLIYGLPYQTQATFQQTLNQVITLKADRISAFNYAHLPERFKPQRRIAAETLPSPEAKLAILGDIINTLQSGGYQYIGMDHFALPNDELAIAQNNNQLHRNFQGYSSHTEYPLLGVGVSAISSVAGHYRQNERTLNEYYAALDGDQLPGWRGVQMNNDDAIRKAVIFSLLCHFKLDIKDIEAQFNIDFKTYFNNEIQSLTPFINDELVELNKQQIIVTLKGRLLIRNICMLFDAYQQKKAAIQSTRNKIQFSRVI